MTRGLTRRALCCFAVLATAGCTASGTDAGPGENPLDPATFVADVSSRPVTIDITGVGSFEADGVGRLAIEIEYVSSPGSGYMVERVPTGWKIHDLVLRNLRPRLPVSDVADLQAWANAPTLESATITFDGLGTELLPVDLYGVLPVSADTTVTSDHMKELVLSVQSIQVPSYTPPTEVTGGNEWTVLEVAGVFYSPLMAPADLDESPAGGAAPITARSLGWYRAPGYGDDGAVIGWMLDAIDELDAAGDISRVSLSEIHRGADGNETDRVNCFEAFPSLLYLFNPTKAYGSTYLIDLSIAVEFCEQAA